MITAMHPGLPKTPELFCWPAALALGLLVLNDHVFKDLYGNMLTGKLSDFAAAYLLPAWLECVAVFLGMKHTKAVYLAISGTLVSFFAIECMPLAIDVYQRFHSHIFALFGWGSSKLTPDLWDLTALIMLVPYAKRNLDVLSPIKTCSFLCQPRKKLSA